MWTAVTDDDLSVWMTKLDQDMLVVTTKALEPAALWWVHEQFALDESRTKKKKKKAMKMSLMMRITPVMEMAESKMREISCLEQRTSLRMAQSVKTVLVDSKIMRITKSQ